MEVAMTDLVDFIAEQNRRVEIQGRSITTERTHSSMTGSLLPAFRSAWTIIPGLDATYVLRCPLYIVLPEFLISRNLKAGIAT